MKQQEQLQVEMQIAPMIDVCFLLLFFYVLTSKPAKPEADIGVGLPGTVEQQQSFDLPDEQRIEILQSGQIVLNEQPLDPPDSRDLPRLRAVLFRFKQSATANRTEALITLDAADEAKHQRIVDVLNACVQSGITSVTFASTGRSDP